MQEDESGRQPEERLLNEDAHKQKVQVYIDMHKEHAGKIMNLSVCRKCFQLTGKTTLNDGQKVEQKCGCAGVEQERWQLNYPDGYNPVMDFNKAYEMCYCCGLEIKRSGSRWSTFYCDDCRTRIVNLNRLLGETLVPIGRHSLMNGVGLSGKVAKDKSKIRTFSKRLAGMFDRISMVEKHYRQTMEKNLDLFTEGGDARVIDVIVRSHEEDPQDLKTEAYLGLLGMFAS